MRFTKKPITIEAVQWVGENLNEILDFCQPDLSNIKQDELIIPTLEGCHIASLGDWIIKGLKGEVYPCKPDIFEMTYNKENNIGI